jgi:2-desacetyl-2-hydroxyethyl bacteriochlorophyllide A dehydrogenase
MRAFVVAAPHTAGVEEVTAPVPTEHDLLVDVDRVGICGTDVELYSGEMAYLDQGITHFPLRLGHEWTGIVTAVGSAVNDSWLGKRVTGDTMLGCGHCRFCLGGHQHVCPDRFEVGITDGWPGALAEQLLIPARFAYEIPSTVSVTAAALVEPGGNALRAVEAAVLRHGERLLILGSGTIGLLAAQFALSRGADVTVAGTRADSLELARSLGVANTVNLGDLGDESFGAVIDATSSMTAPAAALRRVDPSGRIVFIGLSGTPSVVDTRQIALKDVTAVGILSASPGLAGAIAAFADGTVVPDSLVAEVVGLDEVADRLEGRRGAAASSGPKVHVDPRIR